MPDKWNGFTYLEECNKIDESPKYYLNNNLHLDYFKSFTKEVFSPLENDIIVHKLGVGIAMNETHFITFNHLQKIKIRPIRLKHCTILRVDNG